MATGASCVAAVVCIGLIVYSTFPPLGSAASINRFVPLPAPYNYCPCRCCLLPHPDSCKAYFLCLENILYQRECEDGELFNKVLENCDYEERVHCKQVTPEPMEFRCKRREGLFPHPRDCGSFIQCSNWMPYVHSCPSGLHFSVELNRCEYPSDAKCEMEGQTYVGELPTAKYNEDGSCPGRDGMFGYVGNSSLYLQCQDWSPRIRYCPPDTRYYAKSWICTIRNG